MLKKPETKNAYVRKIHTLPLVCTIVLAYMVNARNKGINTLNTDAEKLVSRMLIDTVRPSRSLSPGMERKTGDQHTALRASGKSIPGNEFAGFYREAEKKSEQAALRKAVARQEMTAAIQADRRATAFDEQFPKGRDYDKNPLTEAEKAILKADAGKIAQLVERRNQTDEGSAHSGIFAFEKTITKVFDTNGHEIILPEASAAGNITLMAISVDGAELFVNGRNVSREQFLDYQADFKNAPDATARIKLFAIERVGDGKKSYLKKIEITTN